MTEVFLSPAHVAARLDHVVVVDVREEMNYHQGHVPEAVNIPFEEFRDPTDETEGKLPTAERFGELLRNTGIAPDDSVVVYDGEFGVYASRFVVTAEIFGRDMDDLYVLDGDYTTWQRNYTRSTEVPASSTSTHPCERGGDEPLISADQLEGALDANATVVDTRDPIEYDTVHIPGAVNIQWRALVDEDRRRLESRERRREILAEHGITFDRPVRLYCNTARRISFLYAVLRDLGHEDVAIFEGGIDDWARYGGPVETTS